MQLDYNSLGIGFVVGIGAQRFFNVTKVVSDFIKEQKKKRAAAKGAK